VLTRVASSHIRVGTFQFFAARGDVEGVKLLADHVITRHYPDAQGSENRYRSLYEKVIARQAALVAQWLCIGFIHGVMNTDNVSIAGETIDYGPCAFMDIYHPETVFSSIDQFGRYAYARQPQIGGWNMARLGEALMPLFASDTDEALKQANESLATWNVQFGRALIAGLRRKLGLFTEQDSDGELAQAFFNVLADNGIDFTLAFRRLGEGTARGLFQEPAAFDTWEQRWRQRIAQEPQDEATRREAMRTANPLYIPRNHRVEAALGAATEHDNYGPFEELLTVLARPFEERAEFAAYARPPSEEEQRNFRTY
jgi:uncharacterized protein YdiU (UPF0061 family)